MSAAISFHSVPLGCAVDFVRRHRIKDERPIIKRLTVWIDPSGTHHGCRIHKRLSPFHKVGYNESGNYHRTERTEAGMCL